MNVKKTKSSKKIVLKTTMSMTDAYRQDRTGEAGDPCGTPIVSSKKSEV